MTGSVRPILPVFDVPLQCDLHTTYDFTFDEDWFPQVSSFNASIKANYSLEGDMKLFHDSDFTQGMFEHNLYSNPNNRSTVI